MSRTLHPWSNPDEDGGTHRRDTTAFRAAHVKPVAGGWRWEAIAPRSMDVVAESAAPLPSMEAARIEADAWIRRHEPGTVLR